LLNVVDAGAAKSAHQNKGDPATRTHNTRVESNTDYNERAFLSPCG
jgi:hypothetical protein